jgi:hypothetical protein
MVRLVNQKLLFRNRFYCFDFRNFNQDEVKIDHLRADIAKLNTNIISSCLSQGIQIEFTNAPYTLANLLKLLTFNEYPSRLV